MRGLCGILRIGFCPIASSSSPQLRRHWPFPQLFFLASHPQARQTFHGFPRSPSRRRRTRPRRRVRASGRHHRQPRPVCQRLLAHGRGRAVFAGLGCGAMATAAQGPPGFGQPRAWAKSAMVQQARGPARPAGALADLGTGAVCRGHVRARFGVLPPRGDLDCCGQRHAGIELRSRAHHPGFLDHHPQRAAAGVSRRVGRSTGRSGPDDRPQLRPQPRAAGRCQRTGVRRVLRGVSGGHSAGAAASVHRAADGRRHPARRRGALAFRPRRGADVADCGHRLGVGARAGAAGADRRPGGHRLRGTPAQPGALIRGPAGATGHGGGVCVDSAGRGADRRPTARRRAGAGWHLPSAQRDVSEDVSARHPLANPYFPPGGLGALAISAGVQLPNDTRQYRTSLGAPPLGQS